MIEHSIQRVIHICQCVSTLIMLQNSVLFLFLIMEVTNNIDKDKCQTILSNKIYDAQTTENGNVAVFFMLNRLGFLLYFNIL